MNARASLRERIVPDAVRARVARMAEDDAEIRALRATLGERRTFEWALAAGACSDPVLASLVPPIPPRELRLLVGEPEREIFLWTGLLDLDVVLSAFEAHGPELDARRPSILDFGCGCGRVLRFLVPCADAADLRGVEVDPAMVAWCRGNLPGIDVLATGPSPPLPHAAGSFDLVYSVSVLAQLGARAIGPWLAELARVTRPGGLLVATTRGARAVEHAEDAAELEKTLGLQAVERTPVDATLMDAERVRALAAESGFDVIEVLRGGMRGWQDVVVARRR